MPATLTVDVPPTVAELLERLGHVPAERVRLVPSPGQATEQDVLAIHARTKRLYELIDGVLVEKAMGFRESLLAARLIRVVGEFVETHDLGIVVGEAGMMRLESGRVRMPDVSFVAWSQLPNRHVPDDPIPDLYPDLAVEVISEGNSAGEMLLKRRDYFSAGTRLVWQVDPRRRTVEVFTSPDEFNALDVSGSLEGGAVLPGFKLAVSELFGEQ